MQFKSAVALTVIRNSFSIPETFQAEYRVKIGPSMEPRARKGKGRRHRVTCEKSYRFIYYILKTPLRPEARTCRWPSRAAVALRASTIPIRAAGRKRAAAYTACTHVASYKEHSGRRGRIVPATPVALIRFHPRGKDVALTLQPGDRGPASLDEGARSRCCWRSPRHRGNRINPVDAPGARQSTLTCP